MDFRIGRTLSNALAALGLEGAADAARQGRVYRGRGCVTERVAVPRRSATAAP